MNDSDSTRQSRVFAAPDAMTIYAAATLKSELLALVGSCSAPEVDLSGVSEIDTAGVQVLLLAKREAQRQGRLLTLTHHSPAVRELFDLFNLAAHFGDPIHIEADKARERS